MPLICIPYALMPGYDFRFPQQLENLAASSALSFAMHLTCMQIKGYRF